MSSLILCKLRILFSTVQLKLEHKFSQFIHRFKIGIFRVLVLGCTFKFFSIHKENLGFLNAVLAEFFPIQENDQKLGF